MGEQLIAIVKETMEPEYVSLWLVQPDSLENPHARLLPHLRSEGSEN